MTLKVTRAEFLGIDRMDEDELRDNVLDLLAENAKLRELVRDMMRYYAMPSSIDYKREAALLERAHNLGIETGDGVS